MEKNDIRQGMLVITTATLGDMGQHIVTMEQLKARRPNGRGRTIRHLPGHGGDVWLVGHADGSIAAYTLDELERDRGTLDNK